MKKNEAPASDAIRSFIAGQEFWGKAAPLLGIGSTSVCLSPIQYLITFCVNRLNGDRGPCVLKIRQGTYCKRPALLSDIKY